MARFAPTFMKKDLHYFMYLCIIPPLAKWGICVFWDTDFVCRPADKIVYTLLVNQL